nr:uncharacterized protein LOC109181588 [Ipomoea batatas]GMD48031.1 uncharacterized protein LOC109181588 [Ipomoea batatas]
MAMILILGQPFRLEDSLPHTLLGFSDAIFGLAVVYAGLVMYDAQGVRREVGIHAKVLNQLLSETCLNTSSSHNGAAVSTDNSQEKSPSSVQILEPSMSEELNSFEPELKKNAALFLRPDNQKTPMSISQNMASDAEDRSKPLRYTQLKESIGHTEIQVVAGALLGFLVSLAVCMV